MKARLGKKLANLVFEAATNGDFKSASNVLRRSGNQERKVLTIFNEKALEELGTNEGANLIINFAGYRGFQKGLKQAGGISGICKDITNQITKSLEKTIDEAAENVCKDLPDTFMGWIKYNYKAEFNALRKKAIDLQEKTLNTLNEKTGNQFSKRFDTIKSGAKKVADKIKTRFKAGIDEVKSKTVINNVNNAKIPTKYLPLFENLSGKTGQEYIDNVYQNLVKYMNLDGIAPQKTFLDGEAGLMSVNGGYNLIKNRINFSQNFLTKLPPHKQANLIAHELKHCEQYSNILRCEAIGVNGYARVIAENQVRNAINKSSFENIMFRMKYQQAVEAGKGDEFIEKAIDKYTKDLIPQIEANFADVLKLPKIKANSPEGIKAFKDLEAQRNYKGLDILGIGGDDYRNNPLEVEAYAFGDEIEKIFENYLK